MRERSGRGEGKERARAGSLPPSSPSRPPSWRGRRHLSFLFSPPAGGSRAIRKGSTAQTPPSFRGKPPYLPWRDEHGGAHHTHPNMASLQNKTGWRSAPSPFPGPARRRRKVPPPSGPLHLPEAHMVTENSPSRVLICTCFCSHFLPPPPSAPPPPVSIAFVRVWFGKTLAIMALAKKRKVDAECRVVQGKWRILYFSVEWNGKPTCLICSQQISVPKDYNVRRHYETRHAEKYDKYNGKLREEKVSELEQSMKKVSELEQSLNQSPFKNLHQASEAAVKASYMIAHKLAVSSKPFSEGEFIKKCMIMVAEVVCPDQQQAFANISLSRNTVAERICDLSENLHRQLTEKAKSFIAFSVAIDENTDVTDLAQLAIFIRGIDQEMHVTEEFVEIVPMKDTTTDDDIFKNLVGALDKIGVDWAKAVSLATDGAPQMVGKIAGVAAKLKEKLVAANPQHSFFNFHYILHQETLCSKTLRMDNVMSVVIKTVNFIRARGLNHRQFNSLLEESMIRRGVPYHTEVRWLSRGAVLKHFYELRSEIQIFMDKKGKAIPELQDNEWLQDLAFMVDITEHLNCLNTKMQGRNKVVTEFYDSICAFEMKLQLWEMQLQENNLSHFPTLKSLSSDHISTEKYRRKISELKNEFQERFSDFRNLDRDFGIFCNPFFADVHEVPEELQLEIIDLQCDVVLKDKFSEVGLSKFYQFLGPNYPQLKAFASKILSMFGTMYICEQLFSVMNVNKSKIRSQLTDTRLNSILKIATAQTLTPDFDAIIQSKRCQLSKTVK